MRGVRGTRPLSLTEDPRLPKASKGFLRPQGSPKVPGRQEGEKEQRGSKASES